MIFISDWQQNIKLMTDTGLLQSWLFLAIKMFYIGCKVSYLHCNLKCWSTKLNIKISTPKLLLILSFREFYVLTVRHFYSTDRTVHHYNCTYTWITREKTHSFFKHRQNIIGKNTLGFGIDSSSLFLDQKTLIDCYAFRCSLGWWYTMVI